MRSAAKIGMSLLGKIFWTVGLALALTLPAKAHERPGFADGNRRQPQLSANATVAGPVSTLRSAPVAADSAAPGARREVTQFVMDFDGDHSLDLATVVEQVIGAYSRYTIHLHLASGAEQSVAVTAPPGGLRLEMKDMTGDKVRNDLILRPTLLHWLPTVLVNDGHDHFAIVISNHFADSLSCGQDLESGRNEARASAALMSSGFKARGFTTSRELFPQLREITLVSSAEAIVQRWDLSINSGRAPPALVTSL